MYSYKCNVVEEKSRDEVTVSALTKNQNSLALAQTSDADHGDLHFWKV